MFVPVGEKHMNQQWMSPLSNILSTCKISESKTILQVFFLNTYLPQHKVIGDSIEIYQGQKSLHRLH